jgi:hypothetical protein
MKVVYASNTILLTDSQIGLFSLYLSLSLHLEVN